MLLSRGAAPDAATPDGSTALHLTSQFGHEGVAEALLELGASPSARTADHASALHIASENGHDGVVRVLLRHGAPADESSAGHGWTPLLLACQHGRAAAALALLDGGASVDLRRAADGAAPVHASTVLCRRTLRGAVTEHAGAR